MSKTKTFYEFCSTCGERLTETNYLHLNGEYYHMTVRDCIAVLVKRIDELGALI